MSVAQLITLSNFELTRVFFALVLLLVSAHGFGFLLQRFRMPRVIGEVMGGVVLGPTLLGFLFPQVYSWIFSAFPFEGKLLSIVYWIGLVLLMFISGFEVQKSAARGDKKMIGAILVGSTLIPLIAGIVLPHFYNFTPFLGTANNLLALKIVVAIAGAVTSLPVISRIFIDLGVMQSRFAKIVLSAATSHDIILYVGLAVATGLVGGRAVSAHHIIATIAITVGFFLVMLLVAPRLARLVHLSRFNLILKSSITGYALFICFLFAALASILNVNVVFGALLAGVVVGAIADDRFVAAKTHIREISLGLFVPVYFAVVGLQIDLIHHFNVPFFFGILIFTSFFAMLGTVLAVRFMKHDWRASFNFGVAMNARGGPGIVLATVALGAGIINETFFVSLVLVALVTSLFAGYWFQRVLAGGRQLSAE